ncbi:MAG: aldo/keto reductase, partial [Spirochaetia bacterium]|nr:aldo/keto reductase [Spirochaetia bacterium]
VSVLSLGGLFISSHGSAFTDAKAAIERAVELGINFIDTAPGYLDSEEVLGKILPGLKEKVFLSTKLGYKPEPFEAQNPEFLKNAFRESLKRLNRESVDLLFIHEPDRNEPMDWWKDKERFEGPVNDVLKEMKDLKKTTYTGLGGTTAYEMAHVIETGRYDVLLSAFQYDLLWREAEIAVFPAAKRQNMGLIIGSPLHQGALAKIYSDDVAAPAKWLSPPRQKQFRKLYELVRDCKIPLPELAIRMILSNPDVSTILTGARSVAEVEQNVASASKGPLPKDLLSEINRIAEMVPFRPYLEPLGLPFKS